MPSEGGQTLRPMLASVQGPLTNLKLPGGSAQVLVSMYHVYQ